MKKLQPTGTGTTTGGFGMPAVLATTPVAVGSADAFSTTLGPPSTPPT